MFNRRATGISFLIIVPLIAATAFAMTTPWGWLLFPAGGLLVVLVQVVRRRI
jgi:hypothetical protein